MALRFDRASTFKSFGALDAGQIARLDAIVAQAKASADEAASLVPGFVTNAWDHLIGAGSSSAALESNAHSAQVLYETLKAKRDRLANDPNANEWDVMEMEGATPAFDNTAAREGADQLSLSAAWDQVAVKTANDAADAVKNPFGVPWWVWGAGALGVLFILRSSSRR